MKIRKIRTLALLISSIILVCLVVVFSEQINLKLDEMSKQNEIKIDSTKTKIEMDSLNVDSTKIDTLNQNNGERTKET